MTDDGEETVSAWMWSIKAA